MALPIQLRPYQGGAVQSLRTEIANGIRNIILCAPTGSGKTVIAAHMTDSAVAKNKRVLFVVDRLSLLDQTSMVFDSYGIDHGVIQADHHRFRPYLPVQVCSQQTLARRQWPDADLIIVDEAHTLTETVRKRIESRDVVTIGLTATPFTRGLGKHYDSLVNVTTTDELIREGFLCGYRIFAASEPDMEGVKVVAGEWDEKQTSERAMEVVGDCVTEYLKLGEGKKFICSAVDTAHVEELQRQFMAAGVMCEAYTYKVSDDECARIVNEFRKPDSYIRGIITVTKASKGFDVPDVGVIIMARPLRKSLAEHIQLFGRGLRAHPSKRECIVLDHSGNCIRFREQWLRFFAEGALELDDGKRRPKEKPKDIDPDDLLRKCPACAFLHRPRPTCPNCGHAYPRREAVKHVPGTLKELIATGDQWMMTRNLWPQVCGYAREQRPGDPERARKLALALYKGMTDEWPRASFDTTIAEPVTQEVRNKIRALNIRRAKARGKSTAYAARQA